MKSINSHFPVVAYVQWNLSIKANQWKQDNWALSTVDICIEVATEMGLTEILHMHLYFYELSSPEVIKYDDNLNDPLF